MTNSNVNLRQLNLGEQMYDAGYMTFFFIIMVSYL